MPCARTGFKGRVEPAFNGTLEQLGGDGEEQEDRDERESDVGRHQLELEGRAEDAVTALDEQLEEVAQKDEEDGEDEDDVDVPEDEEEHPVGDQEARQVAVALDEVEAGGEEEQEEAEAADDQPRVLAVAAAAGRERRAAAAAGASRDPRASWLPGRSAELPRLDPLGGDVDRG